MQLEFVSDWKYLPEGIYFDDDDGLSGNFVFGASSGGQPTYTANFDFPIAPGNPATRPMGAVLFKPNGRAYVMMDGHREILAGRGRFEDLPDLGEVLRGIGRRVVGPHGDSGDEHGGGDPEQDRPSACLEPMRTRGRQP